MTHSLIFLGPPSLTQLFSADHLAISESPEQQRSSLIYTLSSTIEELSPPYQYEDYAGYVCENLLPDLNRMMADSGLLVVLCFSDDNITPLAVWGGAGQMTKYSILLCIVSEIDDGAAQRFEMPEACCSPKFAAVMTGSQALDGLRNAFDSLVAPRSGPSITLTSLLNKLGV